MDESEMMQRLDQYDQRGYETGAGPLKRLAWYALNALVLDSYWCVWSAPKVWLLKRFGAQIGTGVVVKPRVRIKYPWHLVVGDHVWLGEDAWIDNLGRIEIGDHACVSQGAYLVTGNHDYRDVAFGLIVRPIYIEAAAWVGARAIICPGVSVGRGAVIAAGSVLQHDAAPNLIYQGNPAQPTRERCASDLSGQAAAQWPTGEQG